VEASAARGAEFYIGGGAETGELERGVAEEEQGGRARTPPTTADGGLPVAATGATGYGRVADMWASAPGSRKLCRPGSGSFD
jgi:hypothetical protein